ncbi:MAG: glycosyltransferase family 2 protein [Lachnospiraceae bacterium]
MRYSVIIPCYKSDQTIEHVVNLTREEMRKQNREDLEFVLVNDCSPDGGKTIEKLKEMAENHADVKVIDLAVNCGQHNALMAALRHAEGDVIIGMDDDGQTHPSQLPALFEMLDQGYDLVYGYYPQKKHSWFRNLGSRFNDLTVNMMIKKPKEVRTSSYFVVRKFVRDYAVEYTGSYTYLLGLFMRCTQNIASVPIQHFEREAGESGYTLKQLIRLWSSIIGFSVVPLRVASITGFVSAGAGLLAALWILIRKFIDPNLSMGWPSIMCAIFFFFGLNFMFLGMIGEYLGRMFLGMNREPQYVIKATYNIQKTKKEETDLL